jgi:hypothetical protein
MVCFSLILISILTIYFGVKFIDRSNHEKASLVSDDVSDLTIRSQKNIYFLIHCFFQDSNLKNQEEENKSSSL